MVILAVDDEKIALEGLVHSIKEAEPNSEVYAFRKADEALKFAQTHSCDIGFLDIQMRGQSGIALAKELKLLHPEVNIVFCTGYADYMGEAFSMHVSGYLMKPVTPQKVREEIDNLRYPVTVTASKRVRISTFGNFEIFIDGKPAHFKYDKTKEMLAYLVDRHGTFCTNAEIMSTLWEDVKRSSYLGNLKKDLVDTLRKYKCAEVIETGWNKLRVVPEAVDCDYFDWYDGKPQAVNHYHGEYMAQYSWAEMTNGEMFKDYMKRKV